MNLEHPKEKRKAGDYEIIHALHIGDREIVVGENPADTKGMTYMCAYCQQNELFARYDEVLGSDSYPEIIGIFGQRVVEQAEKTRQELFKPQFQGIENDPITETDCTLITGADNLEGKIVVIKPEVLRREYRVATHQLKLCWGGFGAYPNSRGSACFCTDLYTGKDSRYERMDVLGTMEPEDLPKWAQYGLDLIRQKKDKGAR